MNKRIIEPAYVASFCGGFIQSKFSTGGAAGIDLHIIPDEQGGIHGKYEDFEFSLTFTRGIHNYGFTFEMKLPAEVSGENERVHHEKLSRLIGDLTIELKRKEPDQRYDIYSASGLIRRPPDQIRSSSDICNDIWNYVLKDPFSKVQRTLKKFKP